MQTPTFWLTKFSSLISPFSFFNAQLLPLGIRYLLVGMVTLGAYAGDYQVEFVSPSKNRAILRNNGGVSVGEHLYFLDKFSEECDAKIIKLTEKTLTLDISGCPNKASVNKESVFSATAQNPKAEATKNESLLNNRPAKEQKPSQGPTEDEDWYTLWGLGIGSPSYGPDSVNKSLDNLENSAGVSRIQLMYDFFGFYWPTDDRLQMHGFVVNTITDSFSTETNPSLYSLTSYLYAYSYHRFFGKNIGDGWFIRGDIGMSKFLEMASGSAIEYSGSSSAGVGALLGGGYAIPLGTKTRVLLGGYYSYRKADDVSISAFGATAGFLF